MLTQPILGGEVRLDRSVAFPLEGAKFWAGITGSQVVGWQRRGKYLLGELSRGDQAAGWLGVHLRMTGQLLWVAKTEPVPTHCRLRFWFPADQELRFVDQRTFGRVWWVPPQQPVSEVITGLQKLGPEPFAPEFSVAYLQHALKGRQRPIKNALLDQALVAGVGNIYADEALFVSGILPTTLCSCLSPNQIHKLHGAVIEVLHAGIKAGGTTFSDFRDVQGINGNYGGEAWVYDRKGQPCRACGTSIERLKLAGRSAHYCPCCQT
jgi:formamidopyrimidine-DNA glycosylase